jgi:hypothetical protein
VRGQPRRERGRQHQQDDDDDPEQPRFVLAQLEHRALHRAQHVVGAAAQELLVLGGVLGLAPPGPVEVWLCSGHVTPA